MLDSIINIDKNIIVRGYFQKTNFYQKIVSNHHTQKRNFYNF